MEKYGIKITLPENDTMRAEHLLGEDWVAYRWFDSSDQRDKIFQDMQRQLAYYRAGDRVSQVLEKIN